MANLESGRHPEAERPATEETESSLPPKKKSRRDCHFDPKWIKEFHGISSSSKGKCIVNN